MGTRSYVCPFCGGSPIKKKGFSERIKRWGGKLGVPHISVEGSMEIDPNPEKEEYYLCNGCKMEYVWATIDITTILNHLGADSYEADYIAGLINYYYDKKVTLTELLTKYRTGIVRRHNNKIPYISNDLVKRQLYICFNYDGIRTFGTFIRKKKDKYFYYTMKAMEIPRI